MNKALATSVSALLTASASYVHGFETWLGTERESHIETGLDNGTGTSGYWFSEGDDGDGGKSKIIWPVAPNDALDTANELEHDTFAPVIDNCGGICGTADLQKGSLTYQPFVKLGFNVAGNPHSGGDPETADASNWGGICITYQSPDIAPTLELGLGSFDAEIGGANPTANLNRTAGSSVMKVLSWNDFKQPSWYKGSTKISGEEAAKQLVSIKFKIQGAANKYDFKICAIGPYAGTCPTTCDNAPTITTAPAPIKNLVYNGEAQELIKAGTVQYGTFLYKHADADEYSDMLPSATEIGDYTIYFMVKGNKFFNDIAPDSLKVSIKEPASSSSAQSSSSSTPTSSSSAKVKSSSSSKIQSSSSAKIKSSSSAKIKSSSSSKIKSSSSKGSKQGLVSAVATSPIKTVLDHNELHVITQTAAELKVNIFDVQGNLKMQYRSKTAKNHLVPLNNLNQGTYLVQITSGIQTQIHQIVIK